MTKTKNEFRRAATLTLADVRHAALFSILLISSLAWLPAAWGDSQANSFPTVPASKWVGLRFIILPQSKAVQHYGYQELYRDNDKDFAPLPYDEYAGRIFRVVGIGRVDGPDAGTLEEADLQMEGDKKIIHGDIDHGCMTDVGPVSDFETARKLYLGKTLWLASDHLSTYDAQKDTSDLPSSPAWHQAFQDIPLKQYSPVKVLGIVPGWYAGSPVRFIVQEESGSREEPKSAGVQGYVDVHMSDTNVPKNLQAVNRFDSTFLESDPRKTYAWSPEIWTALENRKILLGMTSQQVRMSWGEPTAIHKMPGQTNTEQWIYDPAFILTLKDGILGTVSPQPMPNPTPVNQTAPAK